MIFGDVASGKSTFANKLAHKHGLTAVHLDEAMKQIGRTNKSQIKEFITQAVAPHDWVIDGNAFTKDLNSRIDAADIIIVFHFNRFRTFYNWARRYYRIKRGHEQNQGGQDERLLLHYYVPYILYKFPNRKKIAILRSRASGKPIIVFKTYADADKWLIKSDPVLPISQS
jgi:hypothetical protein